MWSGINQARGGSQGGMAARAAFERAGSARGQLLPGTESPGKQTSLAPQGKGLTSPPGAKSVWGIGSATQHTITPLLKISLGKEKASASMAVKDAQWEKLKGSHFLHPLSHPLVRMGIARVTIPAEMPSSEDSKTEICSLSYRLPTSLLQKHHKERRRGPCAPSPALLPGCSEMGSRLSHHTEGLLALPPSCGLCLLTLSPHWHPCTLPTG